MDEGKSAETSARALRELDRAVRSLRAVPLEACDGEALVELARGVEAASRRLEALSASVGAEVARRQQARGRSAGSAATALAEELGVTVGQARRRIETGRRSSTPAGRALAEGEITPAQERTIAEAAHECPEPAREQLAEALVGVARGGATPRALSDDAARRLLRLDPERSRKLEERQQARRAARLTGQDCDGMATLSITCEPRLKALLDVALARFAGPGRCLAPVVDAETGHTPEPDALAAADPRTPEQRAYDALCHVLTLGLESGLPHPRGVASVVVRVTAEELDSPHELVESEAGTRLSVGQAVSMAGTAPWFVSLLREGREELRRIDVDAGAGRIGTRIQRLVLYAATAGGCTHPGCGVAAAKCEFHHVESHARGGPTTVANGTLACPVHHGWISELPDGWRTLVDPSRPGIPRWVPPMRPRLAA